MFSKNDRISSRQIRRLLIFDLFGTSSLLLPTQFAKAGGGIGSWSILAGVVLAGLYLWLISFLGGKVDQDYLAFLQQAWGGFLARVVYLCYAIGCIAVCAWAAKLLSDLVCSTLLDQEEFSVALFFILLLALYGGIAGLEARARIYEILFWVLAIPVIVMLLLCFRQVQAIQWFPLWEESWSSLWAGAWQCFAAFLPLTFCLFLIPNVQEQENGDLEKKRSMGAAVAALLVSGAVLAVIYLVLLGIFGRGALAQEEYPVITLMGMVKIPGDFLKRLDAVMVSVWFFTLYALIAATLYYGTVILGRTFTGRYRPPRAHDPVQRRRRCYLFCLMAAVVYGIAYLFYRSDDIENLAQKLFYFAGMPFLILIPMLTLVLVYVRQWGKRLYEHGQDPENEPTEDHG